MTHVALAHPQIGQPLIYTCKMASNIKETVMFWHEGCQAFEKGDFDSADRCFQSIVEPSARICFNMARVHSMKRQRSRAKTQLLRAIEKDCHFVVAYYSLGIQYFYQARYELALNEFEKACEAMHSRQVIDYTQLGMILKLCKTQIMLSLAAALHRMGREEKALEVILGASRETEDDAWAQKCVTAVHKAKMGEKESLDVEPLPSYCIFHPPKNMVANLEKKEFVAKAKVVSRYGSNREDSPGRSVNPVTLHREGEDNSSRHPLPPPRPPKPRVPQPVKEAPPPLPKRKY